MSVISLRCRDTMVRMAVMSVAQVDLAVDEDRLAQVCAEFGIAELSVFGSVARGETRDDSDLDLLYVLSPGRHLGFSINQLEDELTAIFDRRVDLVSKAGLHRSIRDQVLADSRRLYAA